MSDILNGASDELKKKITANDTMMQVPGGGMFGEYSNPNGDPFLIGGGGMGNIPGAQLPSRNPLAQSMYDQQLGGAKDYASKLSGMSDQLYNNAASTARSGLSNTLRSTRNSYNSRGLLNSGGERGAEAGARSSAEAGLAGTRSQINQGLLQNLQGMEGNAFGTAAGLAQPGPNTAQLYQQGMSSDIAQKMKDEAARSQAYGQIGQGLGALGGAGLAGAMRSGQQNPYNPLYNNFNGPPGYYGTGGMTS